MGYKPETESLYKMMLDIMSLGEKTDWKIYHNHHLNAPIFYLYNQKEVKNIWQFVDNPETVQELTNNIHTVITSLINRHPVAVDQLKTWLGMSIYHASQSQMSIPTPRIWLKDIVPDAIKMFVVFRKNLPIIILAQIRNFMEYSNILTRVDVWDNLSYAQFKEEIEQWYSKTRKRMNKHIFKRIESVELTHNSRFWLEPWYRLIVKIVYQNIQEIGIENTQQLYDAIIKQLFEHYDIISSFIMSSPNLINVLYHLHATVSDKDVISAAEHIEPALWNAFVMIYTIIASEPQSLLPYILPPSSEDDDPILRVIAYLLMKNYVVLGREYTKKQIAQKLAQNEDISLEQMPTMYDVYDAMLDTLPEQWLAKFFATLSRIWESGWYLRGDMYVTTEEMAEIDNANAQAMLYEEAIFHHEGLLDSDDAVSNFLALYNHMKTDGLMRFDTLKDIVSIFNAVVVETYLPTIAFAPWLNDYITNLLGKIMHLSNKQ